jgi:hypothetical protein
MLVANAFHRLQLLRSFRAIKSRDSTVIKPLITYSYRSLSFSPRTPSKIRTRSILHVSSLCLVFLSISLSLYSIHILQSSTRSVQQRSFWEADSQLGKQELRQTHVTARSNTLLVLVLGLVGSHPHSSSSLNYFSKYYPQLRLCFPKFWIILSRFTIQILYIHIFLIIPMRTACSTHPILDLNHE